MVAGEASSDEEDEEEEEACGQNGEGSGGAGDVTAPSQVYRLDRIGCLSSAFPEAVASLDA